MGKQTDYKKSSSFECAFCDYSWKCRKGHPCGVYKKTVKKVKKYKGRKQKYLRITEEE